MDKQTGTRQVILNTALRIASTVGIEGLTIGELAKAVGMSKSGLFAHFKGKDNLQKMVLKAATERFVDVVLKPAFKKPRGEPRLLALVDNWIAYLAQSDLPGGSILIAASTEVDDRPGELREYVKQIQLDLIQNVEKAARLAVEEGHFRNDLDCAQFSWTLYSCVLGYHHFKRLLDDPRAEEHVRNAFVQLLESSRTAKTGAPIKRASG